MQILSFLKNTNWFVSSSDIDLIFFYICRFWNKEKDHAWLSLSYLIHVAWIFFIFFQHTKTYLIFLYTQFFIIKTDLIFYKTKTIFSKFSKTNLIFFLNLKIVFCKNRFDFSFINKPNFFLSSQKHIWFFINQILFFFFLLTTTDLNFFKQRRRCIHK